MRAVLATMLVLATAGAHASPPQASPPGASSCSGCHAGPGTALPAITGRDAADTDAAMAGYRDGSRPATLMNRIAKGFTPDETHAIAVWLEGQR
jgi:sulfide dehydrogenase cytochrome subunit